MAFIRQNEESFLEAIQSGLDFWGGAPRRIIFDNAKVRVKESFGKYAKTQDRYAGNWLPTTPSVQIAATLLRGTKKICLKIW